MERPSIDTDCDLSVSEKRAEPVKPNLEENLARRMLYSIVSKVAERSKRTRAESLRWSMASRRSFCIRRRAVSVEWNFL